MDGYVLTRQQAEDLLAGRIRIAGMDDEELFFEPAPPAPGFLTPGAGNSEIVRLETPLPCSVIDCKNVATQGPAWPDPKVPGAWSIQPMCKPCVQATARNYGIG